MGFRKASTAYSVGNIAYHASLPTGYYLECTTAGTTNNSSLTISNTTIGTTVSDGSVTWTMKNISLYKGDFYGDMNTLVNEGTYIVGNSSTNSPEAKWGQVLVMHDSDFVTQIFVSSEGKTYMRRASQHGTGQWLSWQQQEAIVAKTLGTSGYIKYASDLIIQWGTFWVNNDQTTGTIEFPISFTQYLHSVMFAPQYDGLIKMSTRASSLTGGTVYTDKQGSYSSRYTAIGF